MKTPYRFLSGAAALVLMAFSVQAQSTAPQSPSNPQNSKPPTEAGTPAKPGDATPATPKNTPPNSPTDPQSSKSPTDPGTPVPGGTAPTPTPSTPAPGPNSQSGANAPKN